MALTLLAPFVSADAARDKADRAATDKSGFNLFNPTPAEHLRELSTDGPGATESAYTVDAGHFQVEMALVSYTSDKDSSGGVVARTEVWAVAPLILKVGLLNQLDAQLVLEPYNLIYERESTNRITRRGFGDTSVRLKYNFWGNDDGRTAFAAIPYLMFSISGGGICSDSI